LAGGSALDRIANRAFNCLPISVAIFRKVCDFQNMKERLISYLHILVAYKIFYIPNRLKFLGFWD